MAAREAAQAHALRDYPKEACGLLVDGAYLPCINYATDPERDFVIAAFIQKKLREEGREIQAVIHSHPDGPLFPSESDMIGQISMDLPWVIIPTNGEECADPIIWGDTVDQGPILERPFRHGVTDCYELVRHTFAAGKDELARQGVTSEWMLEPVELRPQARADGWWDASVEATHRSLYDDFRNVGFREIKQSEVLPGDCFLMKLGHKFATLNHGGIYVGSNLILHHLPTRVSRREPIGVWLRAVEKWLRHESLDRYLEEQERSHA
nr:Mov34/MPN/PAD-1 family protein [Methylorubrum extorquens]